jgi:hypothetical protein
MSSILYKRTPREKIRLNRIKAPFIARFPVGMAFFMTDKLKSVLIRETLHFRHDHGIGAGSPQTGQIQVVDDAILCGIPPINERFMEKTFHPEPA